jgi:hypothetical protein
MKSRVANPNEMRCPACDGTGVLAVIPPVQPGRRIYPPSCGECDGKGRIPKADNRDVEGVPAGLITGPVIFGLRLFEIQIEFCPLFGAGRMRVPCVSKSYHRFIC